MKVDRSYDDFLSSIGLAVCTGTLFVSVGKYISSFYFVYMIAILALLLATLSAFDYHNKPRYTKTYEESVQRRPIIKRDITYNTTPSSSNSTNKTSVRTRQSFKSQKFDKNQASRQSGDFLRIIAVNKAAKKWQQHDCVKPAITKEEKTIVTSSSTKKKGILGLKSKRPKSVVDINST